MSTTVTYKGNTLATVNNATKTLKTAGKYLEGDVILTDVTSGGINPIGNINITQSGVTDVTNYATATVPELVESQTDTGVGWYYQTENNLRKWKMYGYFQNRGNSGGMVDGNARYSGAEQTFNAIPTGTTVTPTESAQTIGGANTMMEGAVTVSAIPSTYVGSGVTRRESTDLSAWEDFIIVPSGYYAQECSMSVGTTAVATPTAVKGAVNNHSVSVTPSIVQPYGYTYGGTKTGTAVTVSASELVSGSETKTANGTYDVTNLAELVVNVSGGGATNFVHGTFTTGSAAGAQTVTIPYTGSGYPIMAVVVVAGGAYVSGTDWYNSLQRYAIGQFTMTKSVMSSTPTYTTSGTNNQGVTTAIYKNSTSTSTSYTRTSSMTTNTFSSSNASNAAATCVRFKSNTTMSVYTNTSSYGLFPSTEYEYFIVYSS